MNRCLCARCAAPATLDAPCPDCLDSPLLDGRYALRQLIGRGSGGAVYRATRLADGATFAIKVLHPSGAHHVFFERVEHPGIQKLVERLEVTDALGATTYEVLAFVQGETLQAFAARRALNEREVFRVVADLLDIVASLHAAEPPIVHRDLKPENVLRREDGQLVLIDFGGAASPRSVLPGAQFTTTGTVGYMPTEQIAGVVRREHDLYAVGALALALLTRLHPADLLDEHLELRWENLVELHPNRARFLRRLIGAKDERRMPSTLVLAREARRLSEVIPPRRASPHGLALSAVGACALAAGFVFAGYGLGASRTGPPARTTQPVAQPAPEPIAAPVSAVSFVEPMFRCEAPSEDPTENSFVQLEPGQSACLLDGCEDFHDRFDTLDLSALCQPVEDPSLPGAARTSMRSFQGSLFGRQVRCRRTLNARIGTCSIGCEHDTERSGDEAEADFEAYVQQVRDRYDVESAASIQGAPSYPRRRHSFRSGSTTVGLHFNRDLCCVDGARCGRNSFRTHILYRPGRP